MVHKGHVESHSGHKSSLLLEKIGFSKKNVALCETFFLLTTNSKQPSPPLLYGSDSNDLIILI